MAASGDSAVSKPGSARSSSSQASKGSSAAARAKAGEQAFKNMVGSYAAEITLARTLSDYVFNAMDQSNEEGKKDGHVTLKELFTFVSSVLSNPKIDQQAYKFLVELGFKSTDIEDEVATAEAVFLAMDTNHDGWLSKEELFHGFLVHKAHKKSEHEKMVAEWEEHLRIRKDMQRTALGIGACVALFGVGILLGTTKAGRSVVRSLFGGSASAEK